MNRKIVALIIVFLVIVGAISYVYFYKFSKVFSEEGMVIPINGLSSGSEELISCNGKPYLVVWDSQKGSIYLISMNPSLISINLDNYQPLVTGLVNMSAFADMTCYGNMLYVAIPSNTGTRTTIIGTSINGNSGMTINLQGKRVVRIFYWNGLWVEDWYDRSYHIERLFNNGTPKTIYNFPVNVTPVQENMFVHNDTVYYSFLLGHNTPRSTYELLAISKNNVRIELKLTGNFEYGFSTMVNNRIYLYLLEGSGENARTLLYILNFSGRIVDKHTLSAEDIVHWYENGTFVGGLTSIVYSKDGSHFKKVYDFYKSVRPLWPSQSHTTALCDSWLYELAFNVNSDPQQPMVIALSLGE